MRFSNFFFRNRLLSPFILFLVCHLDVASAQTACADCAACLTASVTHVLISSNVIAADFQGCKTINEVTFTSAVTEILDDGFNGASLRKINFSGIFSALTIGDYAFVSTALTGALTLPAGLTSIGNRAFSSLSLLTSVSFPDSVISIGESAFDEAALVTVTFSGSFGALIIKNYAFAYTALSGSLVLPVGLTSIGSYAFYEIKLLTSITIPNSVTYIGDYAFYGASSLATVTFPGTFSALTIGSDAFRRTALTGSLVLPVGLTSIGSYAFQEARLTSLTILGSATSVTSVGVGAFLLASGLTTLTFPGTFSSLSIEGGAFAYTALTGALNLPSGLTSIGEGAFYEIKLLTSVNIPDSVTFIDEMAFYGASSLATVTFPGTFSALTIGNSAFQNTALTGPLTLPAGLTSVGKNAFSGLTLLSDLTIPDSVTTIGDTAFQGSGSSAGSCLIWDSSVTRSIGTDVFVPNYGEDCLSVVPTAVPSAVSTVVPSAVPSALLTAVPSGMPTVVPSVVPTMVPSVVPSATSTVAPSGMPTVVSSVVPSVAPSNINLPSFVPSDVLSVAPSLEATATPSRKPSRVPIQSPTFRPTRQPSTKPSLKPTPAPSTVTYTDIMFDVTLFVKNVSSVSLDEAAQNAVCGAVTLTVGVADEKCELLGQSAVGRRRLAAFPNHQIRAEVRITASTGDFEDTVEDTNGDNLYAKLTTLLETAVESGVFSQTVRDMSVELNAVSTLYVGETNFTAESYTVVLPEAQRSGDRRVTDGEYAAIMVTSVFIVLASVLSVWWCVHSMTSTSDLSRNEPDSNNKNEKRSDQNGGKVFGNVSPSAAMNNELNFEQTV